MHRAPKSAIAGAIALGLAFAPAIACAASEQALSADAFVESIGINTHLGYTNTAYYQRFPEVQRALLDLGVRHIRDTVDPRTGDAVVARMRALNGAGIRLLLLTDLTTTPQSLSATVGRLGGAVEAVEPPNELDLSHDANWIADARATTHALAADVRGSADMRGLTILGPSLTRRESYASVGDLSGDIDFGNLHNYPSGRPPGFRGYGPQHNASIGGFIREASTVHGSHRVYSTETGYCTNDRPWSTPAAINGVYEPRMFLEQFMAGVARTYQYQFADYGSGQFSQCGLLTADLQPRPAYSALRGLIETLGDRGPAFRPGMLDYELGGDVTDVDHLLLQKRDGTTYLLLWIEQSGYDTAKQSAIAIAPRHIRLTVRTPLRGASIATFDDDGHLQTRALDARGENAELTISDHVSIVRLPAERR